MGSGKLTLSVSPKSIYKYELNGGGSQQLLLPIGSTILDIQYQNNRLMLWAEVPTLESVDKSPLIIHKVGTGHPLPSHFLTKTVYIKTLQQFDGEFVWHFYLEK